MDDRRKVPRHCLVVKEYRELRELVAAFAGGAYDLLCILGGPGLGKSETVKAVMQEALGPVGWGLIQGKHTPLDLYERLYKLRAVPVVLDDLDGLMRKPDSVTILKCLCQSTAVKKVEWGSNHVAFSSGLPKSFDSISRICLILNDWNSVDKNVAALHDRGVTVLFEPSVMEVHRELAQAGWFNDQEVFDFIAQHLFLIAEPSFRFYQTSAEHKRAGLDWRNITLRMVEGASDPNLVLVARLLADRQYDELSAPETARVKAFAALGGGAKATYFRYKAALLRRGGPVDWSAIGDIQLQPRKNHLQDLALIDRRDQIRQMASGEAIDIPSSAGFDKKARLEIELRLAVQSEDYRLAAKIRDEINRTTQGPGESGP